MVDEEDIENGPVSFGTWRQEIGNDLPGLTQQSGNRSSNDVREELRDYFNTNGQVSWQWDFLLLTRFDCDPLGTICVLRNVSRDLKCINELEYTSSDPAPLFLDLLIFASSLE